MATTYSIYAKDATTGAGITGLTPAWVGIYTIDTGAAVSSQPAFTEVGAGFYTFPLTVASTGSVCGTIDLGASVSGAGRYVNVVISSSDASIRPVLSDRLPAVSAGGGGSGTVTSVSVVTANGVSGSVATATTTPAITLTLGAITPTSVAASGTVTGSNLSGTNTGNQTITLTGNVTGSGTGSFATTIAAGAVTNAMLAGSITASNLVQTDIVLAESQVTNLVSDLAKKIDYYSYSFVGGF